MRVCAPTLEPQMCKNAPQNLDGPVTLSATRGLTPGAATPRAPRSTHSTPAGQRALTRYRHCAGSLRAASVCTPSCACVEEEGESKA